MPNNPDTRAAFYETINDMVDAGHDGREDEWWRLSHVADDLAHKLTRDTQEAVGFVRGALLMARRAASEPSFKVK